LSQLNIPNTISLIRIAATPVLIVMLLSPGRNLSIAAAILFAIVCFTDWLDGYYARKWKQVTTLGKFLDPLADKLLVVTAFIMLIQLGRVPAWVVALIVGREIAITGLRSIAVDKGVVIAASPLGKLKTVSQIFALIPLILHFEFYGVDFHTVGTVMLYISLFFTLYSGYDYFVKFFRAKAAA